MTVVHVSGVDEAVQVDMDVVAEQLHVVLRSIPRRAFVPGSYLIAG
jgi:hypothetical protein